MQVSGVTGPGEGGTLGEAGSNVVLHVFVFPEPLVNVPWREFPALLHHDPRVQKLHQAPLALVLSFTVSTLY